MYRGTTPTLQIACDLDLDTCQTVWLTLRLSWPRWRDLEVVH